FMTNLADPIHRDRKQLATASIPEMKCPSSSARQTCSDCAGYNAQEILGATGSYALMEGSMSYGDDPGNSRCLNNGMFMYKYKKKAKKCTDGTSTTIARGEVVGEDTPDGYLVWTYSFRDGSATRNSKNAINTPPGVPHLNNTTNQY